MCKKVWLAILVAGMMTAGMAIADEGDECCGLVYEVSTSAGPFLSRDWEGKQMKSNICLIVPIDEATDMAEMQQYAGEQLKKCEGWEHFRLNRDLVIVAIPKKLALNYVFRREYLQEVDREESQAREVLLEELELGLILAAGTEVYVREK